MSAATPLLSVLRVGAFFVGATYGTARLAYLESKEKKIADAKAKEHKPADAHAAPTPAASSQGSKH